MINAKSSKTSAPESILSRRGSEETFSLFLDAAHELSVDALTRFEEEIEFYTKTGLIGVQMSRMLILVDEKHPNLAA